MESTKSFSFLKKRVSDKSIQTVWRFIRKHKIWIRHKRVTDYWKPVVEDYLQGKLPSYLFTPKINLGTTKIIWQYWGQGFDNKVLPEVVRVCLKSVETYKGEYQIMRLHDGNIQDYLDLPAFVKQKRQNTAFNRTFFSDLLRVCLISTYGGVWLDATILLTKPLPDCWQQMDYFVFQRDDTVVDKGFWEQSYAYYWGWDRRFKVRMLNSVMFAKKESHLIKALQDLLLHYWRKQDTILDYFFFQILYSLLLEHDSRYSACPLESDIIPHLLQTKINNPDSAISYSYALKINGIHKMTYFNAHAMVRFRQIAGDLVNEHFA